MHTRLISLASSLFLASFALADVVTGKIVDEAGLAIPAARVRLKSSRAQRIVPVRPDGTFNLTVDGGPASVVVEVTAEGYEPRRRTLVFRKGVAAAGTITMARTRNLALHSLVILKSAGAVENHIDTVVHNVRDHTVDVVSISLEGSKRARTECLDVTPGLIFAFADTLVAGRADVAIDEKAKGASDVVMASGVVRELACEQQQLQLAIAYPFQLAPAERTKLRLTVPTLMKVAGQPNPVLVDLEKYESLRLTFVTSDGVSTTAARRVSP